MAAGGPSINEEWLTFAADGYHGLFETIKTPMYHSDGSLVGVLGIARDMTARNRAETALKENERRYKSAQRLGRVGNWEYDLVTEKFWGSEEARRLYGFAPDSVDFTTDEVETCIPERERVHQALVDLIEDEKPYDLEFEIRPVSGPARRTIRSIAELVFDENGAPRKVVGVIQDITAQKIDENERLALEKKLKQAQKMESIGTLAGGIAHDFNNILSSVIGFTELALDETSFGTPLAENLQEVLTAAKRARDLVKQILAFARQSDEERKPIQVRPIAVEVLKLVRATTPDHHRNPPENRKRRRDHGQLRPGAPTADEPVHQRGPGHGERRRRPRTRPGRGGVRRRVRAASCGVEPWPLPEDHRIG